MAMERKVNKAMILAAGEGTRLRPLTTENPKVLIPIGGKPLLSYIISWLVSHGISEIIINLYHLGEKIRDFLGDGSSFGARIHYSNEATLLGTAGGVKRVEQFFDGAFVVVCGDILTDFNLSDMVQFHRNRQAVATLALTRMPNPWEAGIVEIDEQGRVLSFVEKPPRDSDMGNLGSGGVYVFEKEIFDYIPAGKLSDFAYDVFPKLLESSRPIYGYVLEHGDYLIDIGTLDKLRKADEDVQTGKVKIKHV